MYQARFEEWIQKQNIADITINNYLRSIRYMRDRFKHLNTNENNLDIYKIDNIEEVNRILADETFIKQDKNHHRVYSSALKKYTEFLKEEILVNNSSSMYAQFEDIVLIKINKSYKENMTPEELYHATSVSWVASFGKTRTRDLKCYCAVYQNEIIEVYDFLGYEEEMPKRAPSRYILHGQVASEELRNKIVGLDIGDLHRGSGNPIKYTNLNTLLYLKEHGELPSETGGVATEHLAGRDLIDHIHSFITSQGFNYSPENIKNLYLSLRSKPFVIISGISGTGKTKIVQLFAESVGATEDNGQFKLIPVRPDWSDSSELLGYLDLKGEFQKGQLTEIIEHATTQPERPHFVLLDEMNLARVEYYFSDVLSVMESRKRDGQQITSSLLLQIPTGQDVHNVYLPSNLYIIGTVNMDETIHPFSKKVLDRANTLEFNEIDLNNFTFLQDSELVEARVIDNHQLEASYIQIGDIYKEHKDLVEIISSQLSDVNKHLSIIKAEVGYRVRDEVCFYMVHNAEAGDLLGEDEAMDFCYMQKILPRISGGQVVRDVLTGLKATWTIQTAEGLVIQYPRSVGKVEEMLGRLDVDGFTSFWIS